MKVRQNSNMTTRVFTHGCFDLLHWGHLRFLEMAAEHGSLIIGVDCDEWVRAAKGQNRPIVPSSERVYMLSRLKGISLVFVAGEDVPYENVDDEYARLIDGVNPDLLVYSDATNPLAVQRARRRGYRVVIVPATNVVSTSSLVERIGQSVNHGN